MPATLVAQGNISRLRGSITFPQNTILNITAPYLGPEGISISLEGSTADVLETMTGTVNSPAPYQMGTVEVELLKTQSFSDLFKQQIQQNCLIGTFIVRPDASTLSNYIFINGSIANAAPGRINGRSVAYVVTLRGYYLINASLYDSQ